MTQNTNEHPPNKDALPTCVFDPKDYLDDLNDFDMSEAEKIEFLRALWNIIGTLVNIGFGLDVVQYLLKDTFDAVAQDSPLVLDSIDQDEHSKIEKGEADAR